MKYHFSSSFMLVFIVGLLLSEPLFADDMTEKCLKNDGVACEISGCADWMEKDNEESSKRFAEQFKAQQIENEKGGRVSNIDWWPRRCRELSNEPEKRNKRD